MKQVQKRFVSHNPDVTALGLLRNGARCHSPGGGAPDRRNGAEVFTSNPKRSRATKIVADENGQSRKGCNERTSGKICELLGMGGTTYFREQCAAFLMSQQTVSSQHKKEERSRLLVAKPIKLTEVAHHTIKDTPVKFCARVTYHTKHSKSHKSN